MKRFLQISSFLVCLFLASPVFAEVSYSHLYISISDALINTKQGNVTEAQKAIDEFKSNWDLVKTEKAKEKKAVDKALENVLKTENQAEKSEAITQLPKALSHLEKMENPVNEAEKRKEFASKYTPFMKQFEEALETKEITTIQNAYNVLNNKWNQYEQPVREHNVGMYGQIETQLAFIRITLAAEEPDLSLASSQYETFKASIEQYLAGEVIETADDYSLQTLVDLIEGALNSIADKHFQEAGKALTEFITVWPNIEMEVSTRNGALYNEIESEMPILVTGLAKDTVDAEGITAQLSQFKTELQLLQEDSHYTFWDSALILLREGLEAILIIIILVSFLKNSKQEHMVRWIYGGALFGVLLSAVVAVAFSFIFHSLSANTGREMLEGYVGLAAAAIMIGVGVWLHNKSSVASWNAYLAKQMGNAISKQSVFAMAFISFLSVFREGAETILFYTGVAPKMEMFDFILGIVVALVILGAVAFILLKMSTRIVIHRFFFAATILIYLLAFKIIGSSVHTLQLTNELSVHVIHELPVISLIGFYPTYESLAGQALLIIICLAVLVYQKVSKNNRESLSGHL